MCLWACMDIRVCFSCERPLTPVLSQGVRNRQRPESQSQVSDQWGVKWIRRPTLSPPLLHAHLSLCGVRVCVRERERQKREKGKKAEHWEESIEIQRKKKDEGAETRNSYTVVLGRNNSTTVNKVSINIYECCNTFWWEIVFGILVV